MMLRLAQRGAADSRQQVLALQQEAQERRNRNRSRPRRRGTKKSPIAAPAATPPPVNLIQVEAALNRNDLFYSLRCSMVGTGPQGDVDRLGRVTVLNWEKELVLDRYVRVPVPVTDYRTDISGITAADLESEDAMSYDQIRSIVCGLLNKKIVIGHGLSMDLQALRMTHPWCDLRDTAMYEPFMEEVRDALSVKLLPRDLPGLAKAALGRDLPPCPIEECGACIDLYKRVRTRWETEIAQTIDRQLKVKQRIEMFRRVRVDNRKSLGPIKEDDTVQAVGSASQEIKTGGTVILKSAPAWDEDSVVSTAPTSSGWSNVDDDVSTGTVSGASHFSGNKFITTFQHQCQVDDDVSIGAQSAGTSCSLPRNVADVPAPNELAQYGMILASADCVTANFGIWKPAANEDVKSAATPILHSLVGTECVSNDDCVSVMDDDEGMDRLPTELRHYIKDTPQWSQERSEL